MSVTIIEDTPPETAGTDVVDPVAVTAAVVADSVADAVTDTATAALASADERARAAEARADRAEDECRSLEDRLREAVSVPPPIEITVVEPDVEGPPADDASDVTVVDEEVSEPTATEAPIPPAPSRARRPWGRIG